LILQGPGPAWCCAFAVAVLFSQGATAYTLLEHCVDLGTLLHP
jgi:hypothetical protein